MDTDLMPGLLRGVEVGLAVPGMMNLVWMLTATVITFAEKTIPGNHHTARPLGVVMVVGGLVLVGVSLLGGLHRRWSPCGSRPCLTYSIALGSRSRQLA